MNCAHITLCHPWFQGNHTMNIVLMYMMKPRVKWMNDLDEYFTYWTKTKTQQYVFRNIRQNDNIHTKAHAMGAVLLTYLLQCLKYIRIWKENRYTNIFFYFRKRHVYRASLVSIQPFSRTTGCVRLQKIVQRKTSIYHKYSEGPFSFSIV